MYEFEDRDQNHEELWNVWKWYNSQAKQNAVYNSVSMPHKQFCYSPTTRKMAYSYRQDSVVDNEAIVMCSTTKCTHVYSRGIRTANEQKLWDFIHLFQQYELCDKVLEEWKGEVLIITAQIWNAHDMRILLALS